MENHVGKICPYCKTEIKSGEAVKVCPSCGIPHHEFCWKENKGCTTFGCSEQLSEPQSVQQSNQPKSSSTVKCSKCGTPLKENQKYCPKCGTSRDNSPKKYCNRCGMEIHEGQAFCPACGTPSNILLDRKCAKCGTTIQNGQTYCPNCGTKIEELFGSTAISSGTSSVFSDITGKCKVVYNKILQKDKKAITVLASVIGIIVLIVVVKVASGSGNKDKINFNKIYTDYCNSTWASVGSDGSYLSIDTNPYDKDDDGIAYPSAYTAIKNVNNELGLPDSLIEDMGHTTGADGKQSQTFEEIGITVSWRYHPDKGLEVTYKKNR